MAIHDEVFKIIKVKIKPRKDSYSDQFSRIFLLKMMMVGAMFTGLTWYSDKINCLSVGVASGGFATTSCWINGFYVYDDIKFHQNKLGYYGIPDDIKLNGIGKTYGELCSTKNNPNCTPMKKTFFLQYQYMTFFLVAMALIYYVPYVFFKYINTDLESLKGSIKDGKCEAIVNSYFNRNVNPSSRLNMRVVGNIICKILYIVANVMVFVLTDQILNGRFKNYGINYNTWAKLNNSMANDYMGRRLSSKPGNAMLPTFLLCNVYEGAAELRQMYKNEHIFICEFSQHIIYQYIFLILWWGMILGIVVSALGLLLLFIEYTVTLNRIKMKLNVSGSIGVNIRECQYLEYMRKKNLTLFGDVLQLLTQRNLEKKGNYQRNNDETHTF